MRRCLYFPYGPVLPLRCPPSPVGVLVFATGSAPVEASSPAARLPSPGVLSQAAATPAQGPHFPARVVPRPPRSPLHAPPSVAQALCSLLDRPAHNRLGRPPARHCSLEFGGISADVTALRTRSRSRGKRERDESKGGERECETERESWRAADRNCPRPLAFTAPSIDPLGTWHSRDPGGSPQARSTARAVQPEPPPPGSHPGKRWDTETAALSSSR